MDLPNIILGNTSLVNFAVTYQIRFIPILESVQDPLFLSLARPLRIFRIELVKNVIC